jgi:hypothetical protein
MIKQCVAIGLSLALGTCVLKPRFDYHPRPRCKARPLNIPGPPNLKKVTLK